MSEIRDKVRKELKIIIGNITEGAEEGDELRELNWDDSWADCILSIPELAIVDREAELPKHLKMMWCHSSKDMAYEEFALEDSFRKAGYVKEEKE